MDNLRTGTAWLVEGRAVLQGQRAEHYLTDGEGHGRPVFSEDQTEPVIDRVEDLSGWTLITRDEWEAIKAAKYKPKGQKIIVQPATGRPGTELWCGANKPVIAQLKKGGWQFRPNHYWFHPDRDPAWVADQYQGADWRVERRGF